MIPYYSMIYKCLRLYFIRLAPDSVCNLQSGRFQSGGFVRIRFGQSSHETGLPYSYLPHLETVWYAISVIAISLFILITIFTSIQKWRIRLFISLIYTSRHILIDNSYLYRILSNVQVHFWRSSNASFLEVESSYHPLR